MTGARQIDPRRIVRCPACSQVMHLTAKWAYPDHPDPDHQGYACRMSRLASGLDTAWAILEEKEPGSALWQKICLEVQIITKTNELVLALAEQERLKAAQKDRGNR